jgi:hypothetical protein
MRKTKPSFALTATVSKTEDPKRVSGLETLVFLQTLNVVWFRGILLRCRIRTHETHGTKLLGLGIITKTKVRTTRGIRNGRMR